MTLAHAHPIALTGKEYAGLVREAVGFQIRGGKMYDALLLKAASKAEVNRIYTVNLKHFQGIASSEIRGKLSEP